MSTIVKAILVGLSVPCMISVGAAVALMTPSASVEQPLAIHAEDPAWRPSAPEAPTSSSQPIVQSVPVVEIRQTPQERSNEGLGYFQDGNWLSAKGQWIAARAQYQKALTIAQELQQTQLTSVILNNLGQTYAATRHYETALDWYQQALTLSQQLGTHSASGRILANMGDVQYQRRQYPQALDLYAQALQQAKGDTDAENTIHQHIQITKVAMQPKPAPKAVVVATQPSPTSNTNPPVNTPATAAVKSQIDTPNQNTQQKKSTRLIGQVPFDQANQSNNQATIAITQQ